MDFESAAAMDDILTVWEVVNSYVQHVQCNGAYDIHF